MPMLIRTTRMEAFSDGVIAIIITVMIFDLKFRDLARDFTQQDVINGMHTLWPRIVAYLFSFLVLGLLWLNHHHMFHLVQLVDEKLIWLNLNFLFWTSLIPLPTAMIGKNPLLAESAAIYGCVMFMVAVSIMLMRRYVHRHRLMHQDDQKLNREVIRVEKRARLKNYFGAAAYFIAVPLAFVSPFISYALFLIPTALFFMPTGVAAASDNRPGGVSDEEKVGTIPAELEQQERE